MHVVIWCQQLTDRQLWIISKPLAIPSIQTKTRTGNENLDIFQLDLPLGSLLAMWQSTYTHRIFYVWPIRFLSVVSFYHPMNEGLDKLVRFNESNPLYYPWTEQMNYEKHMILHNIYKRKLSSSLFNFLRRIYISM